MFVFQDESEASLYHRGLMDHHSHFCIFRVAGCCARGFVDVKNSQDQVAAFLSPLPPPFLLGMFLFSLVIKHAITYRITICTYHFSLEAEMGQFSTCQWSSELAAFAQGDGKDGPAVPSTVRGPVMRWDLVGPEGTDHSIWDF